MADYDCTTNPLSAQYRTLLEIVDDVLARHKALEILREKYFQLRRERGPSGLSHNRTDPAGCSSDSARCLLLCARTRSFPEKGELSIEPPDEMERRFR